MTSLLLLNHNLLIENNSFITFMTTFGVLASAISSICVITYLGPIHRKESTISKDDWRRIYIVCFSALNMLLLTISLLYDFKPYKIVILATVIVVINFLKKNDDELNNESKTKGFVLLRAWGDILCIILLVFLIFIKKKNFK